MSPSSRDREGAAGACSATVLTPPRCTRRYRRIGLAGGRGTPLITLGVAVDAEVKVVEVARRCEYPQLAHSVDLAHALAEIAGLAAVDVRSRVTSAGGTISINEPAVAVASKFQPRGIRVPWGEGCGQDRGVPPAAWANRLYALTGSGTGGAAASAERAALVSCALLHCSEGPASSTASSIVELFLPPSIS